MKLPPELVEALRLGAPGDTVAWLATASRDGTPNLAPQPFTDVLDDEFVLVPDLFLQKTKVNLNENLVGALSVAHPAVLSGWCVEGPCNVFQWGHPASYRFQGLRAGEVLERWGDWDRLEAVDALPEELRPTVFAQRGVVVLRAQRLRRVEVGT
jgi:hypothetical protein